MSETSFWDSLPAHVISALEASIKTKNPSMEFLAFAGGESDLLNVFVNPFRQWSDNCADNFLATVGNLLGDDYGMLPRGARLLQIKISIDFFARCIGRSGKSRRYSSSYSKYPAFYRSGGWVSGSRSVWAAYTAGEGDRSRDA